MIDVLLNFLDIFLIAWVMRKVVNLTYFLAAKETQSVFPWLLK